MRFASKQKIHNYIPYKYVYHAFIYNCVFVYICIIVTSSVIGICVIKNVTQKQAEHGNQNELSKQRRALIQRGLTAADRLRLVGGGDGVIAVVISRCTVNSQCQNDTYSRRAAECYEWQSETSSTKICRQIHVDFDHRLLHSSRMWHSSLGHDVRCSSIATQSIKRSINITSGLDNLNFEIRVRKLRLF